MTHPSTDPLNLGVSIIATITLLIFWLAWWQGIENSREPSLFLQLGIHGIPTFMSELKQLYTRKTLWLGITTIFNFLKSPALAWAGVMGVALGGALNNAGAGAVSDRGAEFWASASASAGAGAGTLAGAVGGALTLAWAGALAVAGAGAGAWALAGALAGAWAVAVTVTLAGAGAWAWAGALAGAVALAWAGALVVALAGALAGALGMALAWVGALALALVGALAGVMAVVGAGAGTVAGAVAGAGAIGVGIGAWYRANENPDRFRFLAILSFPLFCSAPAVLVYNYQLLDRFLPWYIAILILIGIVSICTGLWQWGRLRERQASNPLQGLLNPADYGITVEK